MDESLDNLTRRLLGMSDWGMPVVFQPKHLVPTPSGKEILAEAVDIAREVEDACKRDEDADKT